MTPSEYGYTYESPPYQQESRKRKRELDENHFSSPWQLTGIDHLPKKQKPETLVVPLTPTSPPTSLALNQNLSSPSSEREFDHSYLVLKTQPQPFPTTYSPPQGSEVISKSNIFLRDLHLKSRTYQYNQNYPNKLEEMWEREEEKVFERYAAMNKLLGSRRMNFG